MPYETKWVAPELFLEHKGVKVFHAIAAVLGGL